MQLDRNQMDRFHETGYLMLPNLFSTDEAEVLRRAAAEVYALDREEVVREKDGVSPRTAFAAHCYHEAFRRLGRHPRLIEPVMQLLGGPVYIHQYKVNAKVAFNGDVWQWHQDYGTWSRDDLMPEARAMNIALFVDDVTEFNGPLWIIPGSHRGGVYEAGHDLDTTSYPLWTLDRATVTDLAERGGIFSAKGKAGSVLMFHGNIVHASSPNMSPWGRTVVYLSLCHVNNHIRRFKRPEWIAHRDFAPIEPLSDSCLTEPMPAMAEAVA
ncbi:MAG: phytanoyl-CoA dioxygenase family protein [bacterium]|nr:phytanoyl-CoA dioxygenase family protein [bacterium]